MSDLKKLQQHDRDWDVVIVGGLGHVGLPLGITFAQAGLKVCLYDVDERVAEQVRSGTMPFMEYDADDVLTHVLKEERLHVSLNREDIAKAKYVIFTIGTPVDEYLGPKVKPFIDAIVELKPFFDQDQVIILRSTVLPHTCKQVARLFNQEKPGWQFAYCPERITQGYAMRELKELPQLVAGLTPESDQAAAALFSLVAPKIIHVSVDEAELAKLFTNTWRYVQFAVANQFYMIAQQQGIDFNRLREVMQDGYERMVSLPSAGFAAGPCLLKDTMQLAGSMRHHFPLGQAAMAINEGLPNFIVDELRQNYDLNTQCVGVLGMAFKADIDDTRDSLSFKLANLLSFHGATVLCSDEYAQRDDWVNKEELIEKSDIIIVGVPHQGYRGLTIPDGKKVVDLWSVLA